MSVGEEDEANLTGQLPQSKIKVGMRPKSIKGKINFARDSFETKLQDGDLQRLSNAIVMEINSLAA